MSDQQRNPAESPLLREQLVAYLDGELDSEAGREIERRLAREPEVQQELRQLQQTWDLLDRLPQAELDATFTRSTVEMIALAAEDEVQLLDAALPRQRRRRRLLKAAGLLAAVACGFATVRFCWPEPNRRLLQDLPVLEHLEAYRQTPDLEFLKRLNAERLFSEESFDES
jgi:ferric-dicitrate binding protein FerR (iron transport regulator)